MEHRERKIWLTLISLLLLSSVGDSGLTNVTAQARHVNRPRSHRQINKQIPIPASVYPKDLLFYSQDNRTGFTRKYFKSLHHYHVQMSRNYIKRVVNSEYQAINQARRYYHEKPLNQDRSLVRLAQWRATQANRHFTHYNQKGEPLAWRDAAEMRLGSYRYNRHNIGENMFFIGKLSRVRTNHGYAGYYFTDPKDIAYDNVFDSLNNDAASHWAHGANILTKKFRYVGVGTHYRHSNHGLYVLVEFGTKRPVVHRK